MTRVQTDASVPSSNSDAEPSVAPSQSATGSLGQRLTELRKERGLAIADVVQVIKYSPRQIEALESDQFDLLPDAAIVRGLIRNYARLLKVDATSLLDAYNRQVPARSGGIEVPPTTGASLPRDGWRNEPWRFMALGGTLIVFLIAAAIYYLWSAAPASSKEPGVGATISSAASPDTRTESGSLPVDVASSSHASPPVSTASSLVSSENKPNLIEKEGVSKAQPPSSTVSNISNASIAPNASTAPNAPNDPALRQLKFSFDDRAWVEVKDATQRTIFAQSNQPGTHQVVNGKPPFTVVVGNAPRVQLQYENRPVDMLPYTKVDVARFTLE